MSEGILIKGYHRGADHSTADCANSQAVLADVLANMRDPKGKRAGHRRARGGKVDTRAQWRVGLTHNSKPLSHERIKKIKLLGEEAWSSGLAHDRPKVERNKSSRYPGPETRSKAQPGACGKVMRRKRHGWLKW